jgi:hypothetical protein
VERAPAPACFQNGHLCPSRLCEAKRGWQRLHRDTHIARGGRPSISCLREIAQVKASPRENAAETTGTRSGGSNCREGNGAVVVLFANHRPSIRAYSWSGGCWAAMEALQTTRVGCHTQHVPHRLHVHRAPQLLPNAELYRSNPNSYPFIIQAREFTTLCTVSD